MLTETKANARFCHLNNKGSDFGIENKVQMN